MDPRVREDDGFRLVDVSRFAVYALSIAGYGAGNEKTCHFIHHRPTPSSPRTRGSIFAPMLWQTA